MIRKIILSFSTLLVFAAPTAIVSAQPVDLFNEVCNGRASDSSVCEDTKAKGNPIFGPRGIITKVANMLSILIGIAAVLGIIFAAIKMATNGNNPQEVTQARDLIIYAVVGLVLAAMAQALIRMVLVKI